MNEEIHEGKWGVREGKCVRLNRDRAAELTQPVWSGVGGQQQGKR